MFFLFFASEFCLKAKRRMTCQKYFSASIAPNYYAYPCFPWVDCPLLFATDSPRCRLTCTTWRPAPRAVLSWWQPKWWVLRSTWRKPTWWLVTTWNPNTLRWIPSTTFPPSTTMASTWTRAELFVLIWSTRMAKMTHSTQKMPKFVPWSTNVFTSTWESFTTVSV